MKLRAVLTILAVAGMAVLLFLPSGLHAAEPVALDDIGTNCLETVLDDCTVLTAGYFNVADYGDDDGAPMIAWQTQFGSTEFDGVIGGFVLFEHDGAQWSLLDSGFDGFFQPPRLNDDRVLHMPGFSQGTGAFNTDRLYQWVDDAWQSVAMDDWFGEITLPSGLGIWKGVEYDFSNPWAGYVARTSLWKDDDGNCCPSGGSAVISLAIQDGTLAATGQAITPPEKSK